MSVDREAFEALLANAFAVQQSGLDGEALSSLVEIQQFIASEKFDLNEAMRMISNRTLNLSNADGVAIALLDGNELVYLAGAGSAAKDVGSHLAATLHVSPAQDIRREILRVENVDANTGIEAEICRQFGAMSLLMLPICQNHVLRGVLQVLFNDAHSFDDREMRVYRLMVGALEQGMLRCVQSGKKRETISSVEPRDAKGGSRPSLQSAESIADTPTIRASAAAQDRRQGHGLTNERDFTRTRSRQAQASRAVVVREKGRWWENLRPAVVVTTSRICSTNSCRFGAALATVVLGIIFWLSNVHHPVISTEGSAVATQRDNGEPATGKPVFTDQEPNLQGDGRRESVRRSPEFKRVRISRNEVDYIAEDVTIRRFTTTCAEPRIQNAVKELKLGDDVTIRYLTGAPSGYSRACHNGGKHCAKMSPLKKY